MTHIDVVKMSDNEMHCDPCIRAKQIKLPFPIISIRTNDCFDLIHCDVWGRHNEASSTGAHSFLIIVDDFSGGTWVYHMKYMSEVLKYLPMFINMIETQFNKRVKCIRSDNALEFLSNQL